jgi:signal transduction histidine kinase
MKAVSCVQTADYKQATPVRSRAIWANMRCPCMLKGLEGVFSPGSRMVDSAQPVASAAAPPRVARRPWHVPAGAPRIAVLVFLGYYLGARLGLSFTFLPLPISVLWPPNAILFGALLVVRTECWWVVALAALPAHLLAELPGGIPLSMVLCWYVSNTAEAFLGASLVRSLLRDEPPFATLRGMVVFIVASILAAVASSFLDSAFVLANRWGNATYWELVGSRSLSNMTASLVVAPVVIAMASSHLTAAYESRRRAWIEGAGLGVGLAIVSLVSFSTDSRWVAPCAPLPFLLWAALRFGTPGASTAFAGVAMAAIWAAGHGYGTFASGSTPEITHTVQFFLLGVGPVLLCLAAAMEERQRAQESLAQAGHRLSQAQRLAAMGELAASIAHEINQPMSAILGNVEAAQAMLSAGRLDDAQLRSILEDVRDDGLRAVEIVRHIRNLARHRAPEVVEFDLSEQVRTALRLVAPLARHRGAALGFRCDAAAVTRGDPVHVQQTVLNLVINAMDAMAARPAAERLVRIDVTAREDAAYVAVRDAGPGIPRGSLEQIFDSFYTTKSEGTGLGLSIARSLVEAQGGRIWAENNADIGATVTFTVPLARRSTPGDMP